MPELTTLIGGLSFTECPRWRDGRLYFSDFHTHRVLAVSLDGSVETVAHVSNQPAGLGFLPDGRMLIVSMLDRKLMRRELDGSLVVHADLSAMADYPLNDMVVDGDGRAWVGNLGFDLHGGAAACATVLICVEPDGRARVAAEGLGCPNGTVITPDGRTMIIAETLKSRLSAFPVEGGVLGERRTWAQFGEVPETNDVGELIVALEVTPDGICLDAEGAVWVADALHSRLLRVAEGGRILEEISTNELNPFACMLGGEDGRTLFVCLAPTFVEAELKAEHRASVAMMRVAVPHAGLP